MNRDMPTSWNLESKTDEELLYIAINKLHNRTLRHELAWMATPKWRLLKWKHNRSRFYSHWYALTALLMFMERSYKETSR